MGCEQNSWNDIKEIEAEAEAEARKEEEESESDYSEGVTEQKDLCAKCWEWSTYLEWHMDSHASCFPQLPTERTSPMCTRKQRHQNPTINALT